MYEKDSHLGQIAGSLIGTDYAQFEFSEETPLTNVLLFIVLKL